MIMLSAFSLSLVGCGKLPGILGGDEEETYTFNMKSKKDIEAGLGDNYEITLKYGYSSTDNDDEASYITTKCVGDSLYTVVISDDGTNAYLTIGNKAYTDYDTDTGMFRKCYLMTSYNSFPNVYKQLMTTYEGSLTYNTKSSGRFLDRDVTIYKWTESVNLVIAAASYEWEYIVDNQTGLLLKQAMSYSGSSIEGSASASACFEVTGFQLGGVTITEEKKKICIDEWPTEADFDMFGVNSVEKMAGEFSYSRAIVEDTGIASEKEYVYKTTDSEIFDVLSESFYNAGLNKNRDGEPASFADLKSFNEYSSISTFHGYIGEENCRYDYCVKLEFAPPYNEGGSYTMTVTIYNNNAMAD